MKRPIRKPASKTAKKKTPAPRARKPKSMPGFKDRIDRDMELRRRGQLEVARDPEPQDVDPVRAAAAEAHWQSAVARITLAIEEKGHVAFQERVTDLVTEAGANSYLVDAALALLGDPRCSILGHFELPGTGKCAWCGAAVPAG